MARTTAAQKHYHDRDHQDPAAPTPAPAVPAVHHGPNSPFTSPRPEPVVFGQRALKLGRRVGPMVPVVGDESNLVFGTDDRIAAGGYPVA
jgi:hypothetical protein